MSLQPEWESLIREFKPGFQEIKFIEHGYDNVIAIVDRQLVFRFPRNPAAGCRLKFESALLKHLGGKLPHVPVVIYLNKDPFYAIQNRLPGQHLTRTQINNLSKANQQSIVRELVDFIFAYNHLISPEQLLEMRRQSGLDSQAIDEPWPAYLKKVLGETNYAGQPELQKLARRCYQKWLEMVASDPLPAMSLHDDLHLDNLLFQSGKISGILDFGDSTVGTATEEMRNFYSLKTNFLRQAIKLYAGRTGQVVDPEKVRIWAVTTELASFCNRLAKNQTAHPGFKRTRHNLRQWIPDFPL